MCRLLEGSGQGLELSLDGSGAHDALVGVEGGGFGVVQDGLADAEAGGDGKEDGGGETGPDELDALPDGVAGPEAEGLEVDALLLAHVLEDEVRHAEFDAGELEDVPRGSGLPGGVEGVEAFEERGHVVAEAVALV